jgi:hypothetical protein
MIAKIEALENMIQGLIVGFEADTGLEVTGMSRSFDKTEVTVTLMRKPEVKEVKQAERAPGF